MPNRHEVSLLGLGSMGRALARSLAGADANRVTVWNRTPGRAAGLDVTEAATVTDAVRASRLVLVCLVDYAAVQERLDEAQADLTGRTVVNLTNGTPRQARDLAAWCRERGAEYLDAAIMAIPPIIGSESAMILCSGDQTAFTRHESTLARFGRLRFVGADDGLASQWDLALLTGMYGLFTGFVHAAAMMGSEQVTAGELLPPFTEWISAMTPSLTTMAEHIDSGRYADDVASPLAMQSHALSNFVLAANDAGIRPDLVRAVNGLVQDTVARGHGAADFAAVIEVLRA